ncbi:MAG: hypothetical protein ACYTEL_20860 [Planctomycetota bacterium]|jgi:hypothetical protein
MRRFELTTRWSRALWAANVIVLGFVVIMSFAVDGNGRVFGLDHAVSSVLAIVFFAFGIGMSLALAVADKGHQVSAIAFLIVYLILACPAVVP